MDFLEISAKVSAALSSAKRPEKLELADILDKAATLSGLTIEESAKLLLADGEDELRLITGAAGRVKQAVYGPRVVLFAPLYLSNYCSNDCLYCGFRKSNKAARRKALSPAEAVEQARLLSSRGFQRLLLVAGEHPAKYGLEYITEIAHEIYAKTDIRILHVNNAPLSVEDFRTLKQAGFGVYQCFQETYHPETYAKMHPSAKKKDYAFRLGAMDRALEAGFGDVGIGALLGLYDYRFDVLATIAHSQHLEAVFGAAAHTISVPRHRHAEGSPITTAPYPVSDDEFKKIVAVYRLAVPYAGVVVSTREPAALREEVLDAGASQISAGSSVEPGGYDEKPSPPAPLPAPTLPSPAGGEGKRNGPLRGEGSMNSCGSTAQFEVYDHRGLSEMVRVVAERGLLPSLCTSCYRSGRQGDRFLKAVSSGAMKDICTPNAILSLKEYIIDSAPAGDRPLLEETLKRFVSEMDRPLKADLLEKLALIEKGARDLKY